MRGRLRWSWHARLALASVAAGALFAVPTAVAGATELRATTATFSSVFRSAQSGDTVVLVSGDYGRFTGARKPGMVTVRAAPGATARMTVDFRPAANITLDGLVIPDLFIGGAASKNLVVRNSRFDRGQAVIKTSEVVDANIVFDHNTHIGFVKCGGCYEGRVELPGRTSRPSGVTIENSYFAGGNSDGIQNGGNGVRILDNEFRGIHQIDSSAGVHADSIQLYGSANTVIRGNYFHDVADGIMAADGAIHETIEDNVFVGPGSPFAVTLESDNGSVFRHNTLVDHGICDYHQRCGQLYVGNKNQDPPSSGTIVTDNILTRVCVCAGSVRGFAEAHHNVFTNSSGSASSDIRGRPTFVGGSQPSSLAGYRLAPGSVGRGDASDGTDRGARIGGSSPGAGTAPSTPRARRGLVAAYGFDAARGRRASDASGHHHVVRIRGAERIAHRSGHALRFDGRHDVAVVRDAKALGLRRAMTLEAWVRPAPGRAWRPVLAKGDARHVEYALYGRDPRGRPLAIPGGRGGALRGRGTLPTRRWSHLAVTYGGRVMRLYVNGRLVSRKRRTHALRAGSGRLSIGASADGRRRFKGAIDDVRIYNRALGLKAIRRDLRTPV